MVRIDRYLQHVNLLPSRKDAKAMLDDHLVVVNSKIAKPSTQVKNDDIIILYFDDEVLKIKTSIEKQERTIYVGYEILDRYQKGFSAC